MKYLKISNAGLLDIRLVALMGGTTKSKDVFKIGQFGTGLKYTLAYLFRNNIGFRIFVGTEEMQITLDQEVIREEIFEIICINGHRTSITTKMGEDWQCWMIIRELWCNALDEGGHSKFVTQNVQGEEGKTAFYIQVTPEIQQVIDDWNKYFIHTIEPMSVNGPHAIYPGGNKLRVYKQGVLIHEEDKPALFAYDVKNATLNELREFKGYPDWEISHALAGANEKVVRYFMDNINAGDSYEATEVSFDYFQTWNNNWKTCIGNAKLIHPKALETIWARGVEIDESDFCVVPEKVFRSLTKQFEHVSALMVSDKIGEFFEDNNAETRRMLDKALAILEACSYPLNPELTFHFGYFGDKTVMGKIHRKEKKILISNTVLQHNLSEMVALVIEETEHYNTGFADCSRDFQTHFINLYTRSLLAQHEIEI